MHEEAMKGIHSLHVLPSARKQKQRHRELPHSGGLKWCSDALWWLSPHVSRLKEGPQTSLQCISNLIVKVLKHQFKGKKTYPQPTQCDVISGEVEK